jgi:preprotein translocase subunit SecB
MPPKSKKLAIKPKTQPKVVKRTAPKAAVQTSVHKTVSRAVKLSECFMRDVSFESFLPPSLYPRENRDMDFHLAATVRPAGKNISCVNVAMRLRISPQGNPPIIIYEMIQEGVFHVPCENIHDAKHIYIQGGPQIYIEARKNAMDILAKHGLKPPIPANVDFVKLWQDSNNSK